LFVTKEIVYLLIVIVSVALITINIYQTYDNFSDSFRLAFFQVASIITTTGYATIDYSVWPTLSLIILICLTIFGGCAGSTAGGIKLSRLIILFKTFIRKVKQTISPRNVESIKVNGKIVDNNTVEGVQSFIIAYIIILFLCAFIISIDNFDIVTNFTASLTCISNVGPGLSTVGPAGNFSGFSDFSKLVLTFEMIAGRLEIFPILVLFSKNTWSR
jgi:trk system potassium uptake protein TrkH